MSNATILTSPDGLAWTVRGNPWDSLTGGIDNGNGVAADGSGNLVAAGDFSTSGTGIEQSTDGISWLAETSDFDHPGGATCTIFDPVLGLWFVGGQSTNVSPTPFTGGSISSNRTSWTSSLNPTQNSGNPIPNINAVVALSGGGFCVGSNAGLSWTTPDGTTWTAHSTGFNTGGSPLLSRIFGLATDGTTILAVGYDGNIHGLLQVSTDGGATWTTVAGTPFSGAGGSPNFAAYANGIWIVGDTVSGTIMTASAATGGYTVQTTPFDSSEIRAAAWSSDLSLWTAVGQGNDGGVVMTSPDTVTWTERTTPIDDSVHFRATLYGTCWDHTLGLFVVVGFGVVPGGWNIGTIVAG